MDGFSFAGIHSSEQGCWYHPDAKSRGDEMEDYEISDMTTDHRDGGYYIGARVKPRVFELDCFFEDITENQLERIHRWLRRNAHGELILDHKACVTYDVVTSKRISISLYDHEDEHGKRLFSGTFTATFTCYHPFGRLIRNSHHNDATETELARTGLLAAEIMPPAPKADSTTVLLYNPGTERANTIIRIIGDVGTGLLIRNLTTAQRCKVVELKSTSLLPGAHLELDSDMGQTRTVLGDETELAFAFHDEGYIELAPCTPFVRSQEITHTKGSNIIASQGGFAKHMEGQHLYLNGWKKIREVTNDSRAIISQAADMTGKTATPIVTMNEIELSGDGVALTRLEIEYTPRMR